MRSKACFSLNCVRLSAFNLRSCRLSRLKLISSPGYEDSGRLRNIECRHPKLSSGDKDPAPTPPHVVAPGFAPALLRCVVSLTGCLELYVAAPTAAPEHHWFAVAWAGAHQAP